MILWECPSKSLYSSFTTWVISKVLYTVRFLLKNVFILQNAFTGPQCNLHCALSQRSNVLGYSSIPVRTSSFLMCLITRVTSLDTSSVLLKPYPRSGFFSFGNIQSLMGSCQDCTAGGEALATHIFQKFPILHLRHGAARYRAK